LCWADALDRRNFADAILGHDGVEVERYRCTYYRSLSSIRFVLIGTSWVKYNGYGDLRFETQGIGMIRFVSEGTN
jgi:hypothetical protein